MTKYEIIIGDDNENFVRAGGSLKLVTLAAKEGLAAIAGKEGDFTAALMELEQVDGQEKRQVLRITNEADIVTSVLGKRLRQEKAAQADSEPTTSEVVTSTGASVVDADS